MAELNTLARPYANAAFERAQATERLSDWSDMLSVLVSVIRHEDMQKLIGNPLLTRGQLVDLVLGACADHLDEGGRNFVRLLAEKHRLALVPYIAAQYEARRAEAERRMKVQVYSAVELTEERKSALTRALSTRLNREVALECKTEPGLIGGVLIQAGDLVIDRSVRQQLQQLQHSINR